MSGRRLTSVLVPFSVLLANAVNFLTQLLVPQYLSSSEYSKFATLWSYGQFVAVVFFEWMRFSVVRFSDGSDAKVAERRRHTLLAAYAMAASFLLCFSIIAYLFRGSLWGAEWLFAVSVYAVSQGVFDGRQALARAQFRNLSFSFAWIFRSGLTLAFALAFSMNFSSGHLVLLGLSLAYMCVAIGFGLNDMHFRFPKIAFDAEQAFFLVRYGAFVAVSSSIAAALPAVVRSLLSDSASHGSGGGILALDLSQKALAVIGMLVNVVILQKSIKAVEFGAPDRIGGKLARHAAMSAAVIFPAGALFYELQPLVIKFLVPFDYVESYQQSAGYAVLGAVLLCFRQFSIDTLFVVVGKSTLSIVGPIVAVLVTVLAAETLGGLAATPEVLVCGSMVLGMAASVIFSTLAVGRVAKVAWPIKDVSVSLLGCGLMALGMRYVFTALGSTLMVGAVSAALGVLIYAGNAVFWNLCGVRQLFKQRP